MLECVGFVGIKRYFFFFLLFSLSSRLFSTSFFDFFSLLCVCVCGMSITADKKNKKILPPFFFHALSISPTHLVFPSKYGSVRMCFSCVSSFCFFFPGDVSAPPERLFGRLPVPALLLLLLV